MAIKSKVFYQERRLHKYKYPNCINVHQEIILTYLELFHSTLIDCSCRQRRDVIKSNPGSGDIKIKETRKNFPSLSTNNYSIIDKILF
jgi:hypothetical protein